MIKNSCLFKGQFKIILVVKSQSKYLASQHFDRGQRSEYRIYWSATPLRPSVQRNTLVYIEWDCLKKWNPVDIAANLLNFYHEKLSVAGTSAHKLFKQYCHSKVLCECQWAHERLTGRVLCSELFIINGVDVTTNWKLLASLTQRGQFKATQLLSSKASLFIVYFTK